MWDKCQISARRGSLNGAQRPDYFFAIGQLSLVMAGLGPAIPLSHAPPVRQFYLYILASKPGGAIYIGVTSNLVRRVYEHRNGLVEGHTKRFRIHRLVYFEIYDTAYQAIQREKNIKHWPRAWKTRLITRTNPTWRDLWDEIAAEQCLPKRDGRDKPGHDGACCCHFAGMHGR